MVIDHLISKKAKHIMTAHLLFTAATTLTGSFSYVFLWRIKQDFILLASFEMMYILLTFLGCILAGYLLTVISSKYVLRLGFLLVTLGFISILFYKESVVNVITIVGTLLGLGNGLYWGIYNILQIRETTDNNREHYFGTLSGIFTMLSTFAPAITGFIIIYIPTVVGIDYSGYYTLYAISSFVMLFLAGYSESLPEVRLTYFRLKQIFATTNSKKFRYISLYELLNGLNETGTKMVFIILSFIILKNEFNLGLVSSFFGLLSGVYIYYVGKKISSKKRLQFIVVGTILLFSAKLIFVSGLSLETLMVERLLSVIGGPLFGLPAAALVLYSIENRSSFILEKEQEFLVAREIPLGFGRFFGILFFALFVIMFGNNDMNMIRMWFIAISTTYIFQFFLLKSLVKQHSR